MRHTDIAIVGGGLAGSTAAAMIGRAGVDAILIDPHPVYPPDFRCEKLDTLQARILQKTGLADAVLRAATPDRELWVARFGQLVEKRRGAQHGIHYDTLVNTVRGEIPAHTAFVAGKVTAISTGPDRQTISVSGGEDISARLVVLANGLNVGLRQKMGIGRDVISAGHSTSIGFDMKPIGRPAFDFCALTYYGERPADRVAYLTLFPIGGVTRANLFVYRDLHDPWLKQMRDAPAETLLSIMPGLKKLAGDFEITDFVKIRPVDLAITTGHRQAGLVLVGDAFATSCPAAGTGALKVLMDVERLCNEHIPRWLASPGMGADKIEAFYDDPAKVACDADSLAKAYHLRSLSLDGSLPWVARRWARFLLHWTKGILRQSPQQPYVEADAHGTVVPAR